MKWIYNYFREYHVHRFLNAVATIISQFFSGLLDWVPHLSTISKNHGDRNSNQIFGKLASFIRRYIFNILSVGPLPNHIAFIMDGNRRYARKHNLEEGEGHRAGFITLMSILTYCYELKIKYITVYAFSIDNFNRQPEEVKCLMELMQEKIEALLQEQSVIMEYSVRVHFVGNLKLLSKSLQLSIDRVIKASKHNTKAVLVVCVAYTSTDEIVHAVQESIAEKCRELKLGDIEKHMYMGVAPDVDILVRSSGETRLSNFVLWQTANCLLYCPSALWPELGLRHLVWSVLNFQRHHSYLEKIKKQA
ncbi:uncharacterized protein [Phyllobates terribilis]|uniref:uncharacterized protein n=1 Tax=Phyllobates terribilis TaxID=111132 RepID=UPI003CCB2A71